MSVGSLVAQNVLDCLARHDRRYFLIGANTDPEAPGNFRCDMAYTVPQTDVAPTCLDVYRAILDAERPHLVIPCRDDDLSALAALRAERGDDPAFLCGSEAAAALFVDKLAVYHFALRHGLPFAPTAQDPADVAALVSEHGFPIVAKPRHGAGSRGVAVLRDAVDLDRAMVVGGYVFQPFLAPPGNWSDILRSFDVGIPLHFAVPVPDQYTGQAFIGPDGSLAGAFCSVVAMDAGKVAASRRIECPSFMAVVRAFATAAAVEGHRGPLNLQCRKLTDGRYVPIEVNGRYSGSTSARALQGYDEVELAVRLALGQPLPPTPTGTSYPMVFKVPTDATVFSANAETLRRDGVWQSRLNGDRAVKPAKR